MTISDRYSRQIQMDKVGLTGQELLGKTSVLIVGVGGLGCQVATQLAGAGMGKIILVDHDVVALSNLHRQILFRERDLGESKSLVAARELQTLNSEIEIIAHNQRLNQNNLAQVIDDATIVIDAADNFVVSYILSDYCLAHKIPLVAASVNQTFGWIGVFCNNKLLPTPSLRAVFPRLAEQHTSCATDGVIGTSVGIIGSLQAQEALKVALNDSTQLAGKLLYFDLWRYQLQVIDCSSATESSERIIEFISTEAITNRDMLVDVRNPHEVTADPLPFTNLMTIPLVELAKKLDTLPADKRLVCVCATGQRAMIAAQQLQQHFKEVAILIP